MGHTTPARTKRAVITRIATLTRHRPADPEIPELRRELAVLKIAEAITEALGNAPELHKSQRERLAALLLAPMNGKEAAHDE